MNKTKHKMTLMARAVMLGLLVFLPVTGGAQMTSNKAQEPKVVVMQPEVQPELIAFT